MTRWHTCARRSSLLDLVSTLLGLQAGTDGVGIRQRRDREEDDDDQEEEEKEEEAMVAEEVAEVEELEEEG